MSGRSLAGQGRRLHALRLRIEAIREQAASRMREDPRHADAWCAQAEAEGAPLLAEAVALREAIIVRARRRAKLAWGVACAGCALVVLLVALLLSGQLA